MTTPPAPTAAPLWTDIADVWIAGASAVATLALAIISLFIATQAQRSERRRIVRAERVEFVRLFADWVEVSTKHMATGEVAAVLDSEWVSKGQALTAMANTMRSPGALDLILETRRVSKRIAGLPAERRIIEAIEASRLIRHVAFGWAETPRPGPFHLESWVGLTDDTDADAEQAD